MVFEFRLPDIGEGVAEGEILKWMVREGDQVKEDQPLVEVMTDKVNVQIPAPRSGKVSKIIAKEGDIAKVGQTIMVIDDGSSGAVAPVTPQDVLSTAKVAQVQRTQPFQASPGVLATPATRRLARELGVDISTVRGSGPQGRVTDDDLRRAAAAPEVVPSATARAQVPTARGAREEVIPLRGMRKIIAEKMVKSKQTAAQVTHVDEADMTELVLLREAFKGSAEKRGVRLTYLPFVIKALVPALKEFPYVNSSLDEQAGNIVLKKYYNIGVATDTEQGLIVPVVKDVDAKDIFELAGEIEKLAERARSGGAGPRRSPGLHVHNNQRRRDRGALRHTDNQPPGGGDPRPQHDHQAARRKGRQGRSERHHLPFSVLRPPGPRRGLRGKVHQQGHRNPSGHQEATR